MSTSKESSDCRDTCLLPSKYKLALVQIMIVKQSMKDQKTSEEFYTGFSNNYPISK